MKKHFRILFLRALSRFVHGDKGATAIEYGLIAAGIGIASLTVIFTVGDGIGLQFDEAVNWLKK